MKTQTLYTKKKRKVVRFQKNRSIIKTKNPLIHRPPLCPRPGARAARHAQVAAAPPGASKPPGLLPYINYFTAGKPGRKEVTMEKTSKTRTPKTRTPKTVVAPVKHVRALTAVDLVNKHGLPEMLARIQTMEPKKAARFIACGTAENNVALRNSKPGKAEKAEKAEKVNKAASMGCLFLWKDRGVCDWSLKTGNPGLYCLEVSDNFTADARKYFQHKGTRNSWELDHIYKVTVFSDFSGMVVERYKDSSTDLADRWFSYVLIHNTGRIFPLLGGQKFFTDKVSEVAEHKTAALTEGRALCDALAAIERKAAPEVAAE